MTALPDVAVGDTVLLVRHRHDTDVTREVTITSVGRKYAYIELYGSTQSAFYLDTGFEKSDHTPTYRLFTPEAYAAHKEREAARTRLRALTRSYGWIDQLSADQATRIADILDEEA